jgi:hypothetical protein
MNVTFDDAFEKSIKKLKDAKIKAKLLELIEAFEQADSILTIPNIKKMQGF